MRLLADESCDFGVVLALRAAGHDVVAIAEVSPREKDESVIKRALREERIVVTEDKDFGQLVYANRQATGGVLFLRFPAKARASIARTVVDTVQRRGETLKGKFGAVQPGRVRFSRIP